MANIKVTMQWGGSVTLTRGSEAVSCEDVGIWEEECASDETFDEWAGCAVRGEEGYFAMLIEGDSTCVYGG